MVFNHTLHIKIHMQSLTDSFTYTKMYKAICISITSFFNSIYLLT